MKSEGARLHRREVSPEIGDRFSSHSRSGTGLGGSAASFALLSPSSWGASWFIVPFLGALTILQVVVVPQLTLGGVNPDLVLLVVVARSLVAGRRTAVMWGFVGGLWMDILSGGAMGASSLALMATALLTGIGHNAIFRRNFFVPTAAALSGSLLFSLLYVAILAIVGFRFPPGLLVTELIVPAAVYNAAVMFLATPLLNRVPEHTEYA